MAAKNPSVGIDHVTVVPKPAAPDVDDEAEADEADAGADDGDETDDQQ